VDIDDVLRVFVAGMGIILVVMVVAILVFL